MAKAATFLMKSLYLVLVLIIIAIFLNQIVSLNARNVEQTKKIDVSSTATNILETLAGSEDCLAYREIGSLEGKTLNLSLHRVLDIKKLRSFTDRFFDLQPTCAKDFKFGYRVNVETAPVDISSLRITRFGGVFGRILELIDKQRVTFLADITGSMFESAGTYRGVPISKIDCLKIFLNGFFDNLSPGTGIALFTYGDYCAVQKRSDLLILDGSERALLKSIVAPLQAFGSTVIEGALETGFQFSEQKRIPIMVMLTDGQDTCYGNPLAAVQRHKNSSIVVHTIGFGLDADLGTLQKVSEATGGEAFDARTCEELISVTREQINVNIQPLRFEFGNEEFSKDLSLKRKISISIPINVYVDSSTILSGKMNITLVDGELETFTNLIEDACVNLGSAKTSLQFSYPANIEFRDGSNFACMNFPSGRGCQRLACPKEIDFDGIKVSGKYDLKIESSENLVRIRS